MATRLSTVLTRYSRGVNQPGTEKRGPVRSKPVAAVEFLENRTLLTAVSWAGPATGGDWDTAGNWSNHAIPTSADDVTIGANVSINHAAGNSDSAKSLLSGSGDTLNLSGGSISILGVPSGHTASTLVNLNLSGGILGVDAPVTVSGASSQYTGGNIDGGGGSVLTNTGTFIVSAGGTKIVDDFATLDNKGTMVEDSTTLFLSNGTVTNDGGTCDIRTGSAAGGVSPDGGTNAFNNSSGTLKLSTGMNGATISVPFNNSAGATVEADVNVLTMNAGGTSTGGIYVAAMSAAIDLTGGSSMTFTGAYTGSGAGAVELASGNIFLGSGGATFNFPSGLFQWSGGNIDGSGPMVDGVLTNAGTINVVAGTTKQVNDFGVLDNKGTVIIDSTMLFLSNGTFTNEATGTLDFHTAAAAATVSPNSGTNAFNNGGTVELSTGVNNASFGVPFNNLAGASPIKVTSVSMPTLLFGGGGTFTGANFVVPAGATIDVNASNSIAYAGTFTGSGAGKVSLAGGNVFLIGATTFNFPAGLFQWSGGNIDGQAGQTLTNAGTMTIVAGTTKQVNDFGVLDNKGTVIIDSTMLFLSNGTFTNEPTGTLDFHTGTAAATVSPNGGTNALNNNSGTVKLSTGGNNAAISVPFNGTSGGNVEADVQTLIFSGGGTSTGGNYVAATGAAIDLTGGNSVTFTGTYTGTGAGAVELASGNLFLGTGGATFNFPAGLFQWSAGNINGSGQTLTNAGTMTLVAGSTKQLNNFATLDNKGTVIIDSTMLFLSNGTFTSDGGTLDFHTGTAAATVSPNGGTNALNNNSGTVKLSTGGNNAAISVPFNGTSGGNVEADAQALIFSGGGTSTGGNYVAATGAAIDLTGGNSVTFTGAYTGSGAGAVELASGNLFLGTGGATFSFPAGLFQWSAGNINGSGQTLTNAGTMTLVAGSTKQLNNFATLDNKGTVIIDSTTLLLSNGTFTSDGGTLDFHTGTGTATVDPNAGTNALNNNSGIVKLSTGTHAASVDVPYTSPATTEVDAAVLQINSAFPQFSSGTLTGGTWNVLNGSTLATPSIGAVTTIANGASVTLSGAGATWASIGGPLATNAGDLNLLKGASLAASSDLSNTGGISIGTGVSPNSGSALKMGGSYSQSSGGSLALQIGGRPVSGEFGSISAGGVQLDGGLSATLVNNLAPIVGDQYTILHNTGANPVVGAFTGLPEGQVFQISGLNFQISYMGGSDGRDVVLDVLQSTAGPHLLSTIISDGTAQRSEVRSLTLTFDHKATLAPGAVGLAVYPGNTTSGTPTDASEALGTPTTADGGITWVVPVLANTANSDPTASLKDGIYVLTLHAAKITDSSHNTLSGGDQTVYFHRLFGDINGDKKVNNADYFLFNKAFGAARGSAAFDPNFDFNGDGKINNSDYFQFNKNFGKTFAY